MPRYRIKELGLVFNAPDRETAMAMAERVRAEEQARRSQYEGMGAGERFGGGLKAGGEFALRSLGQMLTPERFEKGLGVDDEAVRAAQERAGEYVQYGDTAGMLGSIVGQAAPAMVGGIGAVRGIPALARATKMLRGARRPPTRMGNIGTLAAEGGVEGAILSPDDRTGGAMMGAGLGAGLGAAGAVGSGIVRGSRQVTPGARFFAERGVLGTPGQANPLGWAAEMESTSVGQRAITGIPQARAAAQKRAMLEIMDREARAPGDPRAFTAERMPTNFNEAIDELYSGFRKNYGDIAKAPLISRIDDVTGMPVEDVIATMAKDTKRLAREAGLGTDDTVRVRNVLTNVEQMLRTSTSPNRAESIMAARSRLREAIRDNLQANRAEVAKALEEAEDVMTRVLEKNIAPEAKDLLRATDQSYGSFKILEDAVSRGADVSNDLVTPNRLQQAVKRASGGRGYYARGGGKLRDYSQAYSEMFSPGGFKTGYANLIPMAAALGGSAATGDLEGGLLGFGLMTAPSMIAARFPGVTRAYMGQTGAQRGLQRALDQYRRVGGDRLNTALRAGMQAEMAQEDY